MSESQSSNVDTILFDDLKQMLPLVQSLISQKQNSSFTRRGSIKFTKNPPKKVCEPKSKNTSLSIPTKKQTEQVEELERRLIETEEALKADASTIQELKQQILDRDSLLNSTQLQLSEALLKLADNNASLEKTRWEQQTSTCEIEALRKNLQFSQCRESYLMKAFETSYSSSSSSSSFSSSMHIEDEIDDLEDMELQRMNEAEMAYISALKTLKEKQDEEPDVIALPARLHLWSLVSGKEQQESL